MGEPFRSETTPDETSAERTDSAFGSESPISARLDGIFDALGDRRQRNLLYVLLEMEGAVVERSRLARRVRGFEIATSDPGARTTREAVAIDLYHHRLPRLEDAGFIRYDRRRGTVRYVGSPLLEELVEHARYTEASATE